MLPKTPVLLSKFDALLPTFVIKSSVYLSNGSLLRSNIKCCDVQRIVLNKRRDAPVSVWLSLKSGNYPIPLSTQRMGLTTVHFTPYFSLLFHTFHPFSPVLCFRSHSLLPRLSIFTIFVLHPISVSISIYGLSFHFCLHSCLDVSLSSSRTHILFLLVSQTFPRLSIGFSCLSIWST